MNVFIICKNEETNIERCVRAIHESGLRAVLVDSGSTDRTLAIANALGAEVRAHIYENHCQTYNKLTSELPVSEWCLVIDADMRVSSELVQQARNALAAGAEVVRAPVRMVWAGYELKHASLYPPKPFGFRGGREYFVPYGHGEQLGNNARTVDVAADLIHDDRKPYPSFLANQVRYGREIRARFESGTVSWRDRVRAVSPLLVLAQPFVSYVLRRGFLDGRGGAIYALDRLIAEAILFREALAGEQPPDAEPSRQPDV